MKKVINYFHYLVLFLCMLLPHTMYGEARYALHPQDKRLEKKHFSHKKEKARKFRMSKREPNKGQKTQRTGFWILFFFVGLLTLLVAGLITQTPALWLVPLSIIGAFLLFGIVLVIWANNMNLG